MSSRIYLTLEFGRPGSTATNIVDSRMTTPAIMSVSHSISPPSTSSAMLGGGDRTTSLGCWHSPKLRLGACGLSQVSRQLSSPSGALWVSNIASRNSRLYPITIIMQYQALHRYTHKPRDGLASVLGWRGISIRDKCTIQRIVVSEPWA